MSPYLHRLMSMNRVAKQGIIRQLHLSYFHQAEFRGDWARYAPRRGEIQCHDPCSVLRAPCSVLRAAGVTKNLYSFDAKQMRQAVILLGVGVTVEC
jgi:hypothetical protein